MIRKGMLKSFDSSAYTASVRIIGSVSVWLDSVKVSESLAAVDMVAGRSVAVLFLDPSNPDEAIVIGLWGVASLAISDTVYGAGWNGVTNVAPSKNAVYDKLAAMISDTAYNATSWNAVTDVAASKNAIRDKIEALVAALAAAVSDTAYNATSWDGVTDVAPSKNAVRDKIEALPAPTKEFFVPCHHGTDATEFYLGWVIDGANERCHIHFMVPQDFTAISNAEVIIHSVATNASMDFAITTWYGAEGEAYNTHQENSTPAVATTANALHAIDISGDLESLAAGDHVVVRVAHLNDTNANIRGVRFRYT